jgi:hypothetical protein
MERGHATFAKVPDQRRTASLPPALHRIRDTRCLWLNTYGAGPAGPFLLRDSPTAFLPKFLLQVDGAQVKPAHDIS